MLSIDTKRCMKVIKSDRNNATIYHTPPLRVKHKTFVSLSPPHKYPVNNADAAI